MPLDISVEDSVFTPVVPAHDDVEFLSGLRMERVSDFDGTGHLAGAGCSWLDERRSFDGAEPSRGEAASPASWAPEPWACSGEWLVRSRTCRLATAGVATPAVGPRAPHLHSRSSPCLSYPCTAIAPRRCAARGERALDLAH